MTSLEIKQLLDEKYQEYCHSDFFIHTDPIQIPKLFEEKEDIEIAGFLAASLAWGQRPTIIKKGKEHIEENDRNTAEKITAPASCSANTGFSSGRMFKNIKK